MNQSADDRDLSAAFQALRQETEAQAPRFRMPRPAPSQRVVRWHARPLVAAAMLAAAVLTVVSTRRHAEREALMAPFLTSTEWQSPTDYLLTTPGKALLSAVPTIGSDSGTMIDSVRGTPQ